jgi:predicted Zn-dependent protease with MMP-like domain
MVHEEITALPEHLQKDLAEAALELPDLPRIDDLTADDPPLPPTILGLFRGAPLGVSSPAAMRRRGGSLGSGQRGDEVPLPSGHGDVEPSSDKRAVCLYRLNLLRATSSVAELREQIRTTLHHELGHLRGEDDEVLRLRGLE